MSIVFLCVVEVILDDSEAAYSKDDKTPKSQL